MLNIIDNIQYKIKNKGKLPSDLKIKIARILCLSTDNIIVKWLLLKKVVIFVTYGTNIGEVMNINSWKKSGKNSGMQSFNGYQTCIYVSCGGDPLEKMDDKKSKLYKQLYSPYLARMQIIAAQNLHTTSTITH
ncbi:MAG TPA: DUF2748 family protein, partial [Candidatus Megaira endosymbiont of Hartmannula sinica]|nr:DUF2748 family protein [Candidatus Megaera endosymbiont of Hartmannula sinica]